MLHEGESQRRDGRYRYRYVSWDGKTKEIYSW
ncbi:MAG: integrase DNA-binding domain-containing protein, partial [Lachnospiraceae bacterium]|nr:integrase DNA-binding domain-containing protein [Lachnospiraceae bacterium]